MCTSLTAILLEGFPLGILLQKTINLKIILYDGRDLGSCHFFNENARTENDKTKFRYSFHNKFKFCVTFGWKDGDN